MTRLFVRYHDKLGPIIVERDGREEHARDVRIDGPSRLVFRPHAPQSPHIVLETDAPVVVLH